MFRIRTAVAAVMLVGLTAMTSGGLLLAEGPTAASAASPPAIWVGSPVAGTWGVGGDASTTPAGGHHLLAKASPPNHWAVDLSSTGSGSGAPVRLYVAPSSSAYNDRVTTRISQIIDDAACRNGGGGDLVTVEIRFDNVPVGQMTVAHIDRSSRLTRGETVSRWGTTLGYVARLSGAATGGEDCWNGPHAHTELRASTNYACWNRGYATGQRVSRSNFIGFVSGPALGRSLKACP